MHSPCVDVAELEAALLARLLRPQLAAARGAGQRCARLGLVPPLLQHARPGVVEREARHGARRAQVRVALEIAFQWCRARGQVFEVDLGAYPQNQGICG